MINKKNEVKRMSYYFKIIKLFRKTFNRVEIKYLSSKSRNKEERIKMNELNSISLTVLSNGFAGIITFSLSLSPLFDSDCLFVLL